MSTESVMLSSRLILCHPFSFCLQSFPASGSFPMSQSLQQVPKGSASVLPMNIQGWFPLGLTDLLAVQGTLKNLLQYHSSKASVFFYAKLSLLLFSRSVVSSSLRPHGLQHARPSCPSPTPRAYPSSHTLSRWCHPTTSSSVIPFSSCLPLHQVAEVLELQLQHQSF